MWQGGMRRGTNAHGLRMFRFIAARFKLTIPSLSAGPRPLALDHASAQRMFQRRGRLLFVNKKQQKNFFTPGRAGFSATGPVSKKFFAPPFFQKSGFLPVSS
jgi:hypothetical protein